ncbi:hypothetical protein [Candidatus Ruminimicrobium bovinum]|uniref:hypothetical protein n=1 Tax=Candidatus Ruminimicrobium bovinum TaxID=3242779 RepID=UPI0039B86F6D
MNNKTLFFVINAIVFFMVLMFVYNFVYLRALSGYKDSKKTYKSLKSANLDLSGFNKMKANVDERQPVYDETFDKYKDTFITNDEIIHDYENKVVDILTNNEIKKFTKSVQYVLDENEMKNISLNLNFNIPYDNLYFLLFDIEKFSTINKFFMTNNSDVVFECRPILHEIELDEFFMGRSGYISTDKSLNDEDFKKVYDKLVRLDNLNIPSWRDLLPVPRNPFILNISPEKAKALKKKMEKPKQTPAKIKDIYIEGILFEKNAPVCVIEGNVYRTGSVYKKDVKIIRILKNGIIVQYKGYNYKIKTNYE